MWQRHKKCLLHSNLNGKPQNLWDRVEGRVDGGFIKLFMNRAGSESSWRFIENWRRIERNRKKIKFSTRWITNKLAFNSRKTLSTSHKNLNKFVIAKNQRRICGNDTDFVPQRSTAIDFKVIKLFLSFWNPISAGGNPLWGCKATSENSKLKIRRSQKSPSSPSRGET